MKFPFRSNRRRLSNRPRRMAGRQVTTRSGRVLKVNSSVGSRWSALREAKAVRQADRRSGQPKSRLKRLVWRLNPKHQAEYWFSRDGAVTALKIVGLAIFAFFILTIGIFAFYRKDLDRIKDFSNVKLGGSLSFYDRTGKVFLGQDYNKVKRVPVANNQISHWIKDATVAVEDRDFYSHRGFDVKGIVRAGFNDVLHRGSVQGGSTITQQLVKLSEDWGSKRNLSTKIKELILAVELERSTSKEEILRQYLNLAPYGSLDYGVQVAAQDYFHRDAKDLTLAQSAMLAAIPKSPNQYSPYNKVLFDKKAFHDRYNYVLDSMQQTGKITKAQANAAKKIDMLKHYHHQQSKFAGIIAPYFLKAAENEIINNYGTKGPSGSITTGAWKITTTLDMNIQKLAEQKVKADEPVIFGHLADTAATVVEDVQTGQYLALVGGLDFNKPGYGEINYAQWPISPGSSFKPYDYSTLIDNHNDAGAGSVLYDTVGPVPGYPCTNRALPPAGNCLWDFDRRSPGPETLRYALGGSRNIPAVKAMSEAVPNVDTQKSVDKVIDTAQRLMNNGSNYSCYKDGADVTLERPADRSKCFTSSAIGDGAFLHLDHHVNGLASLGRMGLSIPATYILQIDKGDGKPIKWTQPHKGDVGVDQVVRPETAYIVNDMLSDPNASYFAYGTKFQSWNGWRIAVKTGTTNNAYDGLMMAYTTKYAVGSWVGYHTRTRPLIGPMENITMPMTRDIIQGALTMSHAKPENWKEPPGIQHLPAYVIRSHLAYGSVEPSPSTEIYPSWYKQPGTSSANTTIDKVSGKIATRCTPALARQFQPGGASADHFSIDIFYGSRALRSNGHLNATDDVHNCGDSKPSVDSFFINGKDVSGGKVVNCNGGCKITATVSQGTHRLNDPKYPQDPGTVNLLVNGSVAQSRHVSNSPSTVSFTYSGGSARVQIQVIDSVLYSSTSSSATIKKGGGGSSNSGDLTFVSAKKTGPDTTISWTGGTGPYSATNCSGSTTAHSCQASGLNHGDSVVITDSKGNTASGTVD